jgi:hypothetical protein
LSIAFFLLPWLARARATHGLSWPAGRARSVLCSLPIRRRDRLAAHHHAVLRASAAVSA